MRFAMPASAHTSCRYRRSWRIKRFPCAGTGQQPAVRGQGIKRAEEAKTLDESAHERVDGDHPFRLQLSERHLNGPLIGAGGVEAIEGKVGRFADAHAGVAKQ